MQNLQLCNNTYALAWNYIPTIVKDNRAPEPRVDVREYFSCEDLIPTRINNNLIFGESKDPSEINLITPFS